MSSGRFASLCEAELKQITGGKDVKSTNNSTKYAVKTFRTYLKDKQLPEDFENWNKHELDSRLRCFYAEASPWEKQVGKHDVWIIKDSGTI